MSKTDIGYVDLPASQVKDAATKWLHSVESQRLAKLDEYADAILKNKQPGWIARNIFRDKPMETREDALKYIVKYDRWAAWEIHFYMNPSDKEREVEIIRKAAEVAERNTAYNDTPKITVSAKIAARLKDCM